MAAELAIFLAIGAVAGVLAGLLGVGGGLVIVPVLVLLFERSGFDGGQVMQLALGTSLATIVFTSLSSIRAHHRRGAVHWPVVWRLAPGLFAGTAASAFVVRLLPTWLLKDFFGLFAITVAVQLALELRPNPGRQLPGSVALAATGGGIGAVSALVGIGGGSLTVPFLAWCNLPMREAVATSAACGLPIALSGALGFLAAGWGDPRLPPLAWGYLYLPAWFGIAATSVLFAPLGAHWAHQLPARQLKRIFALFLAFLGLHMWLA